MPTIFQVGGCVRDELLGLKSKDIDYVFVNDRRDISAEDGWQEMKEWLEKNKFSIFLCNKECFTVRAKFPASNEVADFVLARKEVGGYGKNTRKPVCVVGTLFDDLERRDFTLNALAKHPDGSIIDFFNGCRDLKAKLLRTPRPSLITFSEDPLRLLRALRFSITHNFSFSQEIEDAFEDFDYSLLSKVSVERIREELHKMFLKNTPKAFELLSQYHGIREYIFSTQIKFLPTLKSK